MFQDATPCRFCRTMLVSHWQVFADCPHRSYADMKAIEEQEAALKQAEWQAEKEWNHFQQKLARQERAQKWRPPLQRLLQHTLKLSYR